MTDQFHVVCHLSEVPDCSPADKVRELQAQYDDFIGDDSSYIAKFYAFLLDSGVRLEIVRLTKRLDGGAVVRESASVAIIAYVNDAALVEFKLRFGNDLYTLDAEFYEIRDV